ncbi:MAG: hypothetical protein U1E62_21825 [Alsobacter sp.]
MLGITVPDAIAFGTLVLAILAAWRGAVAGAKAEKTAPPDHTAAITCGAIVDSAALRDLVEAVEELTDAMREMIVSQHERAEGRMADLLTEISEKLDRPRDYRHRR